MDVSNYLSKYEGHEWFGKTRYFYVFGRSIMLYYARNFADAKISIKSYFRRSFFFSVYSAAVT